VAAKIIDRFIDLAHFLPELTCVDLDLPPTRWTRDLGITF
jgi:hypothetical protein